ALRRLDVVRRDDEEARDSHLVRRFGEVHGMRRRVRARACDDRRGSTDGLERRAEEVETLAVRERRSLAGRACDDESVGAVVDEVAREVLERVEVDAAVVAKRRDHRRQDVAEHHGKSIRTTRGATCVTAGARRTNSSSYGRPARPTSAAGASCSSRSRSGSTLRLSYRTSAASARSNRSAHGSRQSRTSARRSTPLRAAFRRSSRTASTAQSAAVTVAPRAAATSDVTPRPQPSSTTRTPATSGSASARRIAAGQSSAQYGRNSSLANASSSINDSGESGRSRSRRRPATVTASEQSVKADHEAGRQRRQPLEGEQHAWRVRLARQCVVTNRERLP